MFDQCSEKSTLILDHTFLTFKMNHNYYTAHKHKQTTDVHSHRHHVTRVRCICSTNKQRFCLCPYATRILPHRTAKTLMTTPKLAPTISEKPTVSMPPYPSNCLYEPYAHPYYAHVAHVRLCLRACWLRRCVPFGSCVYTFVQRPVYITRFLVIKSF